MTNYLIWFQAELRRSGFENLLAAGVVLTGGTSKMEALLSWLRKYFMPQLD